MKALETDWTQILRTLPAWLGLSLHARRAALDHLRPSGLHPAAPLEPVLHELEAAGFAERSATGVRAGVPGPRSEFVKLMRELDRAPVWESPGEEALDRYLQEHFTSEEVHGFRGVSGYSRSTTESRHSVADAASSEAWVEEFLGCASAADATGWEFGRGGGRDAPALFPSAEVFAHTQALVRALLAHPRGVPLQSLPELTGAPPDLLSATLRAALRYLLVFAGLDEASVPWIGVWPQTVTLLSRPEAAPPARVVVGESFHAALLMEDMTSLLAAAVAEPLRLRAGDGAIFARTQQEIARRLVTIPRWAAPLLQASDADRVETASALLQTLGFARAGGGGGTRQELRLAPTKPGSRWLALSDRDRLGQLLDGLRSEKKQKRDAWGAPLWGFSPVRVGYGDGGDLRGPLTEAFLALPADGFVPLADFLESRARIGNPLIDATGSGRFLHLGRFGRPVRRNDAERLWKQVLSAFLAERLVALGGARLGRTEDGRLCIALASPGRYLLGAADEFDYGIGADAPVIVQPNFEIVFLAPAPRLEAQLGRLAERVGAGPGVMFRLTRASVLAAAEAGRTAEQVSEMLREASSRPVPENVLRQLRDWHAEVRRVRLRSALLVECPDAETAARVCLALGKQARSLTPTLLEISTARASRTALLRQLRAGGVFVDE